MTRGELASLLEDWLQSRFGQRAVINSRPIADLVRRAAPELTNFYWLEVLADDTGAPAAVGMRVSAKIPRCYEIIEWLPPRTLVTSRWRHDPGQGWAKLADT